MGFAVSAGKKEEVYSVPNVVPLCDVLLVLLIIFMIVTPLVQGGAPVNLVPAQYTSEMPDDPELILIVQKDGKMFLNDAPVTAENLQNTLEEALLTVADRKLYLRADQDLEYGKLVDLMDLIRESGIEVMGMITERKTEKIE
jgi:biopolymer transport protein TolR